MTNRRKCDVTNYFYSEDEVQKCDNCGLNKHDDFFQNSTRRGICDKCDEQLEQEYQDDLEYLKKNPYDRY